MDVVPFLKASMWLLPACLHAPGENLRSSDRAVAALLCRVLLEDAALELTLYGSQQLVWRSGGASALVLRSAGYGKACSLFFTLGASLLASTSSCSSETVCGRWRSALGGNACVGCSSLDVVHSLLLCPRSRVSPGPTSLPVLRVLCCFDLVSLVVAFWFPPLLLAARLVVLPLCECAVLLFKLGSTLCILLPLRALLI
jgi:hypothetical protein